MNDFLKHQSETVTDEINYYEEEIIQELEDDEEKGDY